MRTELCMCEWNNWYWALSTHACSFSNAICKQHLGLKGVQSSNPVEQSQDLMSNIQRILWKSWTPFVTDSTVPLKSRVYSVITHECFCYPHLWFMSWSVSYARIQKSLIVLRYYPWQHFNTFYSYTIVLYWSSDFSENKIKDMQKQHLISIPLMNHMLILRGSLFPLYLSIDFYLWEYGL